MFEKAKIFYRKVRVYEEVFENYVRANGSSQSVVFATFMNQAVACHHSVEVNLISSSNVLWIFL